MKTCKECGQELNYCKECASFHCCIEARNDSDEKRMEELRAEFGGYVDYPSMGSGTKAFGKMRDSAVAWQNHLYGAGEK